MMILRSAEFGPADEYWARGGEPAGASFGARLVADLSNRRVEGSVARGGLPSSGWGPCTQRPCRRRRYERARSDYDSAEVWAPGPVVEPIPVRGPPTD